jgi:hypothetical protein
MNFLLSAQGLDQTEKYSLEILAALDGEEKKIDEVIASQRAQEEKLDSLFGQLEKLELSVKGGVSEASKRETKELVGLFAAELKIDRAEVREALEEMSNVGEEFGGIIDALGSLGVQVIWLACD